MRRGLLKKLKFWWVGGVAIGLTLFFFFDLAMYFYRGEDTTLSATVRSVLAVENSKDIYRYLASFLCGVWFSHFFQFGAKVPKH